MKQLKKKVTTVEYIRNNPKATAREIAEALGVSISYIYALRKKVKEGKRKITVTRSQVEIAKKLGVPLEDFVKESLKQGILKYDEDDEDETGVESDKTDVNQILGERGNRYGTFESNAKTCQLLKNVLHSQDGWYRLSYVQREAVEMMMHKISRLVNGDAAYLDTVVDIAGYNQLMLEHMRDRNAGKKVE